MRPYRIHQALFFGVQTLRPLLKGFPFVLLFHLVYFPLNLAEVIDPAWERFCLSGYLAIPALLLLRGLWLAIRRTPRLALDLEEKWGLDFKLVNALSILKGNFSETEKRKADSEIVDLFARIRPSFHLRQIPFRSLAASGAFATLFALFHAVDHRHWEKFLDNTESILRSGSIALSLSYPRQVREGDAFQIVAGGDFSEGLLEFRGATTSGEAGLTNGVAWSSGPLGENVRLRLVFRKGRLVREIDDEVRLFRRPEIGLIETDVVDAATGETLRYK
ncbi:MAG: hypothetical protein JNM63_01325, partial [Spirochaetia bacterium]|nr:hypothetical protein [Spirochaetia bacterium]